MYNITLAGNPNVGKSTIFNNLTGSREHTGNWPGKTVGIAKGIYKYDNEIFNVYDIPGTYSLISNSKEEEIARDFIINNDNLTLIVCDATNVERNLNLVLQTLEITNKVIVCVNLIDEAKKKGIYIDINRLSNILKVPVIAITAKNKNDINRLKKLIKENINKTYNTFKVTYDKDIEDYLSSLNINRKEALNLLNRSNLYTDSIVSKLVNISSDISNVCVKYNKENYDSKTKKIDKILTNKLTGIPIMLLLLFIIFYITLYLSNYPSELLSNLFNKLESPLYNLLSFLPNFVRNVIVYGAYKAVSFVVSVMLVPLLIFFPLFTLLEDVGYLPRIVFNIDKYFRKANSCGKQCLTMCMGFGCNVVGITNCRIIDSKRERLLAILTNSFVPCNGRFPMIIALISMFLVKDYNNFKASLILVLIIIFSVVITLIVTKILSKTILKGEPSSFTLELPTYRKPEILKTILRSIYDKALVILGKSLIITIPTGIIIYTLANINIGSNSILASICNFINPFAKIFGLDGVILTSFILGLPANEIVIPIMMMSYSNAGVISSYSSLVSLKELFLNNNWDVIKCICTIVFTLFHFPCATSIMAIKKETNSIFWTILSIIIPLLLGLFICFIINSLSYII